MNDGKGELPETVVFRLGVLGSTVADLFAERIEEYDLKPKHAGLMTALSRGTAASQQELAGRLGVAPSLVVALADHLETLGAVRRVRDPRDRRRQVLTLTDHGRELLAVCAAMAHELDEELLQELPHEQREGLKQTLGLIAAQKGLPT